MATNILLWLVPLLIIPLSWSFYKYVPFRKPRYVLYVAVLTVAFVLDLNHVSFRNGTIDTVFLMLVCFVVAEFFWNIRLVAKGKQFSVLLIIAICLYGAYYRHWIAAGPPNAPKLWNPVVMSAFKAENAEYRVLEQDLFDRRHPAREIRLLKKAGFLPLEKQINAYRTPEGFYLTPFSCKWSITPVGVRADIYDKDRKEWTLGEGF